MGGGEKEFDLIQHLNTMSANGEADSDPGNFYTDGVDPVSLARELDFFTNSQFFDFDLMSNLDSTGDEQHRKAMDAHGLLTSVKSNVDLLLEDDDAQKAHKTRVVPDYANLKRKHSSAEETAAPPSSPAPAPLTSTTTDDDGTSSQQAAEEDKRRRNTLASARFRAKKKEREKALENEVMEMRETMEKLQGRVRELELENGWLRGLAKETTTVKEEHK